MQKIVTIVIVTIVIVIIYKFYSYVKSKVGAGKQYPVISDTPSNPIYGTNSQNFDPQPLTDELHEDINCIFCIRNDSIYKKLAQLSTQELMTVYNDWQARYYSENNESMVAAMDGEQYGNDIFNSTGANSKTIIARLRAVGMN